jgi:hypothetical protein
MLHRGERDTSFIKHPNQGSRREWLTCIPPFSSLALLAIRWAKLYNNLSVTTTPTVVRAVANEGQSTGCIATTASFSFACTSFLHFVYAASLPPHILPLNPQHTKKTGDLNHSWILQIQLPHVKKWQSFFLANIMPSMSEWSITWRNLKWI